MTAYVIRRVGSVFLTLLLLSMIAFVGAEILPGNAARAILGVDASEEAVAALTLQLGLDRPAIVRYFEWISNALTGDLGMSYASKTPVLEMIATSGIRSLGLAAVTLLIIVPLSVLAGLWSAKHEGSLLDRVITYGGMALMVVPGFVIAIIFILLLGVIFPIFPITAMPPPGSGAWSQLYYLLLPALVLSATLFGYLARIVRANALDVYKSDYVRTATLKGLSSATITRKHVFKNTMAPSIIVIATQIGYLLGGLVIVEKVFNYPGLGVMMLRAAEYNDMPVLEAGIMLIGVVYTGVTLFADVIQRLMDPRLQRTLA
ncbi:ABC transporter permease [Brucella pseudogrignonensis]|uniref:ABC transporter permease n=1 Tax=Brucella pseudogrignonensis TaxID=419475 RepID=UPI003ED06472